MFGDPPQPTGPPHHEVCESLIYATGVYVFLGPTHPPIQGVPIFTSPRVQYFELYLVPRKEWTYAFTSPHIFITCRLIY